MCFTDFLGHPLAREYCGYSMIFVTVVFLAVNMGFAMKNIIKPLVNKIKYCMIRKLKMNRRRLRWEKQLKLVEAHI